MTHDDFIPPDKDIVDGGYMAQDKYDEGEALLDELLASPKNEDSFRHITNVLSSSKIDAALYLLYLGHKIRAAMGVDTPEQELKNFRTLLQTASALGAMVSRERIYTTDKFDRMWDKEYIEEEEEG